MNDKKRFAATETVVHREDAELAVIVFADRDADQAFEVAMPINAARLLHAQLTIVLNAHQHQIPE